jgi:Protein tyrosine and serine/threonine kinase
LTVDAPFPDLDPVQAAARVLGGELPPLSDRGRASADKMKLLAVLTGCFQIDPRERWDFAQIYKAIVSVGGVATKHASARGALVRASSSMLDIPNAIPTGAIAFIDAIGSGKFGDCYGGIWQGTRVALKGVKEAEKREFMRELGALRKAQHPHCVSYFGTYEAAPDTPVKETGKSVSGSFIVMEWMNGGSLRDGSFLFFLFFFEVDFSLLWTN